MDGTYVDGNQRVYFEDFRGRLRVRDAMLRVFSPKGFDLIFTPNTWF